MKRKTKPCEKCNIEIVVNSYKRHFNSCNGIPSYHLLWSKNKLPPNDSLSCGFCGEIRKNANSRRNHERYCDSNPNRVDSFFKNNQEYIIKARAEGTLHNGYTKAKSLGLPKPEMSEETKEKLRYYNTHVRPPASEESKKKISETIKKKVLAGTWHTSLAKKMHYDYNGVDLHGKWELNYAKWLDSNNIKWTRCKQTFEYTFEGKLRRYTPDFYLPDSKQYIEIKGYKKEKDEAKWLQFPTDLTLTILMKKDLKQMGIIIK